jgi:flavin-dependent dehydrogenase
MSIFNITSDNQYDVIICGGGVAGLLLARHLKITFKDISILIIEQSSFPHDDATHKVGESTVEVAGLYLSQHLKLKDYLNKNHFVKFGLRYLWWDMMKESDLPQMPELGLSEYPKYEHYQLDRGIFENDLYEMNLDLGIQIEYSAKVDQVSINKKKGLHHVQYVDKYKVQKKVESRWVIDASGRRRILQNSLNLKKKNKAHCSSLWFRVKGVLDVNQCVPKTDSNWHNRIKEGKRYFSTVHLMGKGYWIWIIPLSSGNTSIGIVTHEEFHPFKEYYTKNKALKWIKERQPVFYDVLKDYEILDCLSMPRYSYSSKQVFSFDRWACVGEAAVFPDPFYSPGFNFISYENILIVDMIKDDFQKKLTESRVQYFNDFILSKNEWTTFNIQSSYSNFGNPLVFSQIYIWDLTVDWAISNPQIFNLTFLDQEKSDRINQIIERFYSLHHKVKQLFMEWGKKSPNSLKFKFIDYNGLEYITDLRSRVSRGADNLGDLYENFEKNVKILENVAIGIFLSAVEDAAPEKLPILLTYSGLNASAISLEFERWKKDGLFIPEIKSEDFLPVWEQIRKLYTPSLSTNNSETDEEVSVVLNL